MPLQRMCCGIGPVVTLVMIVIAKLALDTRQISYRIEAAFNLFLQTMVECIAAKVCAVGRTYERVPAVLFKKKH